MTFHNEEQNELEDITENIKLKIAWPTRNHPSELWCMKTEPKTPQKPMWDPTKYKIWYHEIFATSPHAIEQNWSILEVNWWTALVSK
jgi:hypothetical protein